MTWCSLNGQIMALEHASISPMDRGFLFGDGVYEVMAQVGGRIRAKSLHCRRLESSLIEIDLFVPVDQVFDQVDQLCRQAELESAKIYVQITRGVSATREHVFPDTIEPTTFLMISEFLPEAMPPAKAIVRPDIRWLRNSIKSVSLLGNVLLLQEAREVGAVEAILHRDDLVTEASTSNIFFILEQSLVTPPLSSWILPGITRHLIIEMARKMRLDVVEREVSTSELKDFDGLFVSSSTRGLQAIVELEPGGIVGSGNPPELFSVLQSEYDLILRNHG